MLPDAKTGADAYQVSKAIRNESPGTPKGKTVPVVALPKAGLMLNPTDPSVHLRSNFGISAEVSW